MALDEPKSDDESVQAAGLTFLLGSEMRARMGAEQKVVVDYNEYWKTFSIRLWWGGRVMGGSC